jgi:hypothetical protein
LSFIVAFLLVANFGNASFYAPCQKAQRSLEATSQPAAVEGGLDRLGRGAFIAHVAVRHHPRRKHHHHDEQASGVDL